mgnify:CR=1 FL=1
MLTQSCNTVSVVINCDVNIGSEWFQKLLNLLETVCNYSKRVMISCVDPFGSVGGDNAKSKSSVASAVMGVVHSLVFESYRFDQCELQ